MTQRPDSKVGAPAAAWAAVRGFFSRTARAASKAAASVRDWLDTYWLPGRARRWAATQSVRRLGLAKSAETLVTYQPVLWVAAKVVAVILAARMVLGFDQEMGRLLSDVVGFFQLDQIYNFELPTLATYTRWSGMALLGVVALAGGYAMVLQVQALFSTVVLDLTSRTLYYVEGYVLLRRVHTVAAGRIEVVTLRQWLLTRLLGIGTLDLTAVSGERMIIRAQWRAPETVAALRSATGGATPHAESQ